MPGLAARVPHRVACLSRFMSETGMYFARGCWRGLNTWVTGICFGRVLIGALHGGLFCVARSHVCGTPLGVRS